MEEVIHTTGKRKTAVARIWFKPGDGEFRINKSNLDTYFTRESDRALIMEPFEITQTKGKYDIYANVRGSGISGQAGAIRHGISRALAVINPELREALKRKGFLTRDSRMKERKKYGQRGARARFQYSKR